jgi:CCR4-NOT transcriptional regulation complex NOT5 subunit
MNVLARRPVQIIAGVLVALVLFGGGYTLGSSRATPAPAAATAATGTLTARGAGGQGAAAAAGRGVANGQILAVNSDSITISVRQAGAQGASPTVSTQLVLVGTGTRVVKTVETDIKLSDLKVGDTVTVAGTPDTASGTIAAQAIVLGGANILGDILGGTQFPGGGRGAAGSPRPSGSPKP